ncbi:MAG: GreA/GreB family elongation factor, partial [Myxococcota bacterium]
SSVWHDNFAYEENQRQMHQLAARVRELEQVIARLQLVPVNGQRPDTVRVGVSVRVQYEEEGREQVLFIGGYEDGDPAMDRISYNSPLARVLLGRGIGDVVKLQLGAKARTVEVLELLPPPREELMS